MSIIQVLAGAGASAPPPPVPALFDAASSGSGATGTTTWSHTVTGSNTVLIVGIATVDTLVTGVTYGGVSMTLAGMYGQFASWPHTNARITVYGLIAPAAGANDIVVTTADALQATCAAKSYTLANQTTAWSGWMSGNGTGTYTTLGVVTGIEVGDIAVGFMAADQQPSSDTDDCPGELNRVSLADGGIYIWSEERQAGLYGSTQLGWYCYPAGRHWATGGVAIHPA